MRDVVDVTHHLLFVAENRYHPGGEVQLPSNGLVAGSERFAAIYTGVHSGRIDLTVRVLDGRPANLELEAWDEVVEIDLRALGDVRFATVMTDVPANFPSLTPTGAPSHRLRVHARGRDTKIDGTTPDILERYLVEVWPGAPQAEAIYKQTDSYGAELRKGAAEAPAAEIPLPTTEREDWAVSRERILNEHSQAKPDEI